uniref:Paramyosin-like n=1 Tax=Oryza sativa subsp. japonica TaxID=39947 RepID=Q656C3_ORYSJ|nr:paramyosin-like [Oryza sativa Japonica Group]
MVFPSNAHPGRVVEGGGRERGGRNSGDKSSAPAIREGGGGGGLSQGGGKGEMGKMESPRRGGVGGARAWLAKLRRREAVDRRETGDGTACFDLNAEKRRRVASSDWPTMAVSLVGDGFR